MTNFKLKYENSENIKTDRVNTIVFNLPQMKQRNFFFGIFNTSFVFQQMLMSLAQNL